VRNHRLGKFVGLTSLLMVAALAAPVSAATATYGWSVIDNPHDAGQTYLYDLAVLSPSQAWTVGVGFNAQAEESGVIERWDGAAWFTQAYPKVDDSYLSGVAALSDEDVWAVGHQDGPNYTSTTLIEHLDGSGWARVASPNPSKDPLYGENELYDVTAVAPDDVWAAGYAKNDDLYSELLVHWNGTRWRAWPVSRRGYRQLFSIDAVSSRDIWTVGFEFTFANGYLPITEHWDGTSWRRFPVPTLPDYTFLYGVDAVSADDVWAVGYQSVQTTTRPLTLHWDGSSWAIVPSPPTSDGFLQAVAAVSSRDVWAVGHRNVGGRVVTLSLHWDGAAWSGVRTPSLRGAACQLFGVAPDGTGNVWAVGTAYPRALVVRSHH
jgi:hypothetical protein